MGNTTIYLGADHRGFMLKEQLKHMLTHAGYAVRDLGAHEKIATDDYPQYGLRVGRHVAKNSGSRGIVVCGSGIGIAAAANKIKGVRAGLAHSAAQAEAGRRDDLMNVLAIASDFTSSQNAKKIVRAFLKTNPGTAKRYLRRARTLNRYGSRA